jgi:DNA polymerase V
MNQRLKVMTVVGTRPEIIRLSRVMAALDTSLAIEHIIVHTGQNYDYELNQIFFDDLQIRKPDYFLNAAGKTATETIGKILINIDPLLEKIDINDVWGVGKQMTKFYHQNGIYNAKQLKNMSNTWIKKSSNVLSSRTALELRGIPCIPLETKTSKRKSCVVSRSFGTRVEKFQELEEAVASYCLNASEKIRSESLIAKSITVSVRTSPFQNRGVYYSNAKTIDFPIATNNSIEIVKTALIALNEIFINGYRYQKAGITLTGLVSSSGSKNLFSTEKDEKIKGLMRSIDSTNYKYGRSTLSLASAGVNKKWNMRRDHSSKIDTADFHSLPIIKAI